MNEIELKTLQSLDLETKVRKSMLRINEAVNYFTTDRLYTSFSGGKDSTVLHHLVKSKYKDIPSVFVDTGLEYPKLREFAYSLADTVLKPEITFYEVLRNYGYPVISKSQSLAIRKLTKQNLSPRYRNKLLYGDERGCFGKLSNKWHYLLNADFNISEQCCDVMKKKPFKEYEKKTGRIPITGIMAEESANRRLRYIKDGGCNAFESKRPHSQPLGFWTEQDILRYIKENNIKIADPYGDVILENGIYKTTKEKRTGCVFCIIGSHLEDKNNNRFIRLKKEEPNVYNYCMNGGEYDTDGYWKPKNGLGMSHVLDCLNINYE